MVALPEMIKVVGKEQDKMWLETEPETIRIFFSEYLRNN